MSTLADKLRELPTLIREVERLEAQNARLRELVREAYLESWGELSPNEYREEYWETSAAKAALDKEANDGSADA